MKYWFWLWTRQIGHSKLQASVISIIGKQVCCWWSEHNPQSSGQPFSTFVEKYNGIVPGLIMLSDLRYQSESLQIKASEKLCSGQNFLK